MGSDMSMTEAVSQIQGQPGSIAAQPGVLMPAHWRDFWALTKPGVIRLVVFTGLCGLLAAPGSIHPVIGFVAILCIAMGAGGAAALNQYYESDLDALMKRTANRPIPAGRMDREAALQFGLALSGFSVVIMGLAVNWLAAAILAFSVFYYAVIYTIWLKPNTPQNIVIGGGAGAFPPVIGWAAVTGDVTMLPILLFSIIFFWTPPHFWALALFVKMDYARVGIPMMPNVAGEKSTRHQVFGYSLVLLATVMAPAALGLVGWTYGISAFVLSAIFVALAARVGFRTAGEGDALKPEKQLFAYSIVYLFLIFAAVVVDRAVVPVIGA
ncbi:protoheme IX farnesyltransferase [Blastomonas natatoria]|uniref:Protoheme IX farnesyltransferase n=2 Tax=Blastomonas natatoria TaxID=34015 RepID=A0A2V3VC48_9SPHN|nr:protoheme IX farnesyltransferase [Blastomonas natatoria]